MCRIAIFAFGGHLRQRKQQFLRYIGKKNLLTHKLAIALEYELMDTFQGHFCFFSIFRAYEIKITFFNWITQRKSSIAVSGGLNFKHKIRKLTYIR